MSTAGALNAMFGSLVYRKGWQLGVTVIIVDVGIIESALTLTLKGKMKKFRHCYLFAITVEVCKMFTKYLLNFHVG